MFGKGIFINTIKSCSGGDTRAIAVNAAVLGLNFVAVKIARGWFGYNYRKLPNGTWLDDYIPMLRDDLAREGIDLWGWGSCWLLDGDAEASTAVERVHKFGLKAFLIDAEAQAKISPDRKAEARKYADRMNELGDLPVMLCSYRWPSLHPQLPWDELLAGCDYHAPQVYWIHGSDPAGQLARSISELNQKRELPFVPAGPAFSEHGWKPTPVELNQFNTACIDKGCAGLIWWEYHEAHEAGFFDVIQAHQWESPAPPPKLTLEEKVDRLWLHHPELRFGES